MHFESGAKTVMQLTLPAEIPDNVLSYVVAHEMGHVLQQRNWLSSDGNKLEINADQKANEWGFSRTQEIDDWIGRYTDGKKITDASF